MTSFKKLYEFVESSKMHLSSDSAEKEIQSRDELYEKKFTDDILLKDIFINGEDYSSLELDIISDLFEKFSFKSMLICHQLDFMFVDQLSKKLERTEVVKPTFDVLPKNRFESVNDYKINFIDNSLNEIAINDPLALHYDSDLIFIDLIRTVNFKKMFLIGPEGEMLMPDDKTNENNIPDIFKTFALSTFSTGYLEKTFIKIIDYLISKLSLNQSRLVIKAPREILNPRESKRVEIEGEVITQYNFENFRKKYFDNVESIIDAKSFCYIVILKKKTDIIFPLELKNTKWNGYSNLIGFKKPVEFEEKWSLHQFETKYLKTTNEIDKGGLKKLNEIFKEIEIIDNLHGLGCIIYDYHIKKIQKFDFYFEKGLEKKIMSFFKSKPIKDLSILKKDDLLITLPLGYNRITNLTDFNAVKISVDTEKTSLELDWDLFKISKKDAINFQYATQSGGLYLDAYEEIKDRTITIDQVKEDFNRFVKFSKKLINKENILKGDLMIHSWDCMKINKHDHKNIFLGTGVAIRSRDNERLLNFLSNKAVKKYIEFYEKFYSYDSMTNTLRNAKFPDLNLIEKLFVEFINDKKSNEFLSNDAVFQFTLRQLTQLGWELKKDENSFEYAILKDGQPGGYLEIKFILNDDLLIKSKSLCKELIENEKAAFGIYYIGGKYFLGKKDDDDKFIFKETYLFPSPSDVFKSIEEEESQPKVEGEANLHLILEKFKEEFKAEFKKDLKEGIHDVKDHVSLETERVIKTVSEKIDALDTKLNNIRLNSSLSEEEKIKKFEIEIDGLNTSSEVLENIDLSEKKWYKNWDKLQPNSKTFLKEAYAISKYIKVDYSPVVVQLFRTIENELSKKIFISFKSQFSNQEIEKFIINLGENISNPKQWNIQLKPIKRQFLIYSKPKFTYENIENILSFIPKFDFIGKSDFVKIRKRIYNQIMLFKEIEKHLNTKFDGLNDELIFESFRVLRDERNGGAHDRVIVKEDFNEFIKIFDNVFEKFTSTIL